MATESGTNSAGSSCDAPRAKAKSVAACPDGNDEVTGPGRPRPAPGGRLRRRRPRPAGASRPGAATPAGRGRSGGRRRHEQPRRGQPPFGRRRHGGRWGRAPPRRRGVGRLRSSRGSLFTTDGDQRHVVALRRARRTHGQDVITERLEATRTVGRGPPELGQAVGDRLAASFDEAIGEGEQRGTRRQREFRLGLSAPSAVPSGTDRPASKNSVPPLSLTISGGQCPALVSRT